MDFSKFFIDRPIFAAVLSIVIFAAGLIAIPMLPISEYPEVVPPSVVVRTVYPGANPKVIAETVATPLEGSVVPPPHAGRKRSRPAAVHLIVRITPRIVSPLDLRACRS